MSDFCKQCSTDTFGKDFREMADITTPEEWKADRAAVVICEGCGHIQVDPDGNCVTKDCLKKGHGGEHSPPE